MDFTTWRLLGCICMMNWCSAQYHQHQTPQQEAFQPQERVYREPLHTPPPPQILSHKQAQNHDGDFKYAFAAENGLVQGEYIAADGSRNGGYTYVDPNGKKISVKYTAGKEGFKIIEGDHIPRAPPQIAHPGYVAAPSHAAYNRQSQPQGQYDDGQYRDEKYSGERQNAQLKAYPQIQQPQYSALIQRTESNSLDAKEYHDEPGKPHSFGAGYSFEFGG